MTVRLNEWQTAVGCGFSRYAKHSCPVVGSYQLGAGSGRLAAIVRSKKLATRPERHSVQEFASVTQKSYDGDSIFLPITTWYGLNGGYEYDSFRRAPFNDVGRCVSSAK